MPAQWSRILFEEKAVSNLWAGTQMIVQKIYPVSLSLSHAFSFSLSHILTHMHTHIVPLISHIPLTSLDNVSARCVSSGSSNPWLPTAPQTPMHVALCYFKCEIHSPPFLLHLILHPCLPLMKPPAVPGGMDTDSNLKDPLQH